MTSTACDDQWAMDRDAAVDELARTVGPTEWRGGGNMRHAGHTITWGEYCMRRHELEEEEEHYSEAPCGSDASACDLNPCGACYAEDSDSESALSQALREAKQPRYQDHNGDDWIDEFARTATPEEFRGAMRFTVGKYLRRLGRKDAELSEVRKMRDYCQRWEAYLMELES